jgi:hypothetical protein
MSLYDDLIKFGIVDPPSEEELAQLPRDVALQLADTLAQSSNTSSNGHTTSTNHIWTVGTAY